MATRPSEPPRQPMELEVLPEAKPIWHTDILQCALDAREMRPPCAQCTSAVLTNHSAREAGFASLYTWEAHMVTLGIEVREVPYRYGHQDEQARRKFIRQGEKVLGDFGEYEVVSVKMPANRWLLGIILETLRAVEDLNDLAAKRSMGYGFGGVWATPCMSEYGVAEAKVWAMVHRRYDIYREIREHSRFDCMNPRELAGLWLDLYEDLYYSESRITPPIAA